MLQMKEVHISDKARVDAALEGCPHNTLEYNFTSTFIWRKIYNFKLAQKKDWFILFSDSKKPSFLYPYGKGEIKPILDEIMAYCKRKGIVPAFHSVSTQAKEEIEKLYPGQFSFTLVRDAADYIYERESLATLKGKKLSAKRNHINRFLEAYPNWRYERITKENIEEVYRMNLKWCAAVDCSNDPGLQEEACAVKQAFQYFFDLKLDGGLLRAQDDIVAFSMGDRLNAQTYLVHIEKAFAEINGAYPMINKQFVLENTEGYQFVDREDDAGEEGLRKAKLSYRPAIISEKYFASYIG